MPTLIQYEVWLLICKAFWEAYSSRNWMFVYGCRMMERLVFVLLKRGLWDPVPKVESIWLNNWLASRSSTKVQRDKISSKVFELLLNNRFSINKQFAAVAKMIEFQLASCQSERLLWKEALQDIFPPALLIFSLRFVSTQNGNLHFYKL